MSTPSWESVTPLKVGMWDIRVWRTEETRGVVTDQDLMEYARGLTKQIVTDNIDVTRERLLEELARFPNVSAIEVADTSGSCVIEYLNWPA